MKRFLQKKIPIYFLIIAIGLLGLIVYQFVDLSPATKIEIRQAQAIDPNCIGKIELIRQKDFQLIKPLLMTELLSPSEDLKDLNRSLALEVNSLKSSGKISDASVYVRRLNSGEWTSVNDNAAYAPGSIIKIAAMITYLKMAEENPAMMKKKYLFQGRRKGVPNQTFNNDDPMVAGKEYSAKELLNRVIINSDNDATLIINESLDLTKFKSFYFH